MTELILYTGPMFSSKTTRLLQKIDRLHYQGKVTLSFKPKMDDRYSVDGVIVTHNDAHVKCFQVENGEEILKIVASSNTEIDCVAVDEIFMIPGEPLRSLVNPSESERVLVNRCHESYVLVNPSESE